MKNVQIPYDLFVALLQYHLMMDDDYANEIRHGLEQKLEAMVRHEWYAKYKTAPTPEEREAARQRYLDERGVPQSFRWTTSPWERRQERATLLWMANKRVMITAISLKVGGSPLSDFAVITFLL